MSDKKRLRFESANGTWAEVSMETDCNCAELKKENERLRGILEAISKLNPQQADVAIPIAKDALKQGFLD